MAAPVKTRTRIPPGTGALLSEPLLYSPYLQRFQEARRSRYCLACYRALTAQFRGGATPVLTTSGEVCTSLAMVQQHVTGQMDEMGRYTCHLCQKEHVGRWSNLTAPRLYNRFMLLAGRGGGKTLIGAHAVREELMIPGALIWALGATYKLLWDSTWPTLIGLLQPEWIAHWDQEHDEITLKNGAKVAFRSLDDPQRARGPHGVGVMWFDEAAQAAERAWDVGTPMLTKAGGIAIATTTPFGYDWTYERLERKALVYHEPGFFAAKWRTTDNPLFQSNPVMMAEIERARRSMPPELFSQEYEAERYNAQGLVYGQLAKDNFLADDDAVKAYIPEWPAISPSRQILVGLDSGGDHPFGAAMGVVTERGIVIVRDFLERMRAHSVAHDEIYAKLGLTQFPTVRFAANKNELNLILEWGIKGTTIDRAENRQEIGIQRVSSWLVLKQLKFAYTARRTFEQMCSYRYAENTNERTGEKKIERVFKLLDELPDAVRYMLMSWPELPNADLPERTDSEQRRWDAFDERTRVELLRQRDRDQARANANDIEMRPEEDGYPIGEFYGEEGELGPSSGVFDDMASLY